MVLMEQAGTKHGSGLPAQRRHTACGNEARWTARAPLAARPSTPPGGPAWWRRARSAGPGAAPATSLDPSVAACRQARQAGVLGSQVASEAAAPHWRRGRKRRRRARAAAAKWWQAGDSQGLSLQLLRVLHVLLAEGACRGGGHLAAVSQLPQHLLQQCGAASHGRRRCQPSWRQVVAAAPVAASKNCRRQHYRCPPLHCKALACAEPTSRASLCPVST